MDDSRWEEALEWLRFHCVLGKSVACSGVGEDDMEFAQTMTCRLLLSRGRERVDHINSYTFDCWLLFASGASDVMTDIIDPIDLGSICSLDNVADASLLWWRLRHGERCEVEAALEAKFGVNGEKTLATDDPLGRLDCYRLVMGEACPELLWQAEEHVKWGVVGVLQNKDYFVSSIRELYEKAARRFPSLWTSAGRSLFRTNTLADLAGDNRDSWLANGAIYRSAVHDNGFRALHRVRGWDPALSDSRFELSKQVEALIEVVDSADEIAALAAVCLGLGCYFGYGEMDEVSGMVARLKEHAETPGICERDYPAAMTEAVRVAEEYESTKDPVSREVPTDANADYRACLAGMVVSGLMRELKSVCATDEYGGKVLCVLDALSMCEDSRLFAGEIEEAVSGWLLEIAQYASFSHRDEVVDKAAQIIGSRHFATTRLPDRGRDWFSKHYSCNAEGVLFFALGIELQVCNEEEARDALLELCEVVPCWLSAAGRLELPYSEPEDSKEDAPSNLLGYLLGCLLRLTESCALEVRYSAMQGIRAMLAWCPHAADALCAAWPGLTDAQNEAVLEVIESVDLSKVGGGHQVANLLRQELAVSNRLDRTARLHCLASLQEGRAPDALLSCEAPAAVRESAESTMPINEMPRPAWLLTRSLDEPCRSIVLGSLAFCAPDSLQILCFDAEASSLRCAKSEYLRSSMEVLYAAEQVSLLSEVELSKKTALLLGSDTPAAFLRVPRYLQAAEGLGNLDGVGDWIDRLAGIAFAEVEQGWAVVGYQVLSPGDYCMYQLDTASYFGEGEPASLLSVGDMALLRAPLHLMESSPDCFAMVVESGGMCSTWYSSPSVVVSSRFTESVGLVFDPFELSFSYENKRVLRYERLVFQPEAHRHHVPYCAVTMVSRWVADAEWLSGMEKVHGSLRFKSTEQKIPYNG